MKKTKALTKKQRKALVKVQREFATQNPKPAKSHKHDMWCLSSFLQRQEEAKHAKLHFREEKRNSVKQRKIEARKALKAAKAARRAKREARLGKNNA
jgi:hypothetical protein